MGILTFLKGLLSAIGPLVTLWLAKEAKQSGRSEVELANAKATLEQVQAAREIEREVANADLADLAQRMRKYQRE